MIDFLRRLVPNVLWKDLNFLFGLFQIGHLSNPISGEGEDMILRKIFYKKSKGFYVDIGTYHPKKSSNTYFFYKKGWNGINIDVMPGSMNSFERFRKRDINLEIPLGKDRKLAKYYKFENKALNGFESPKLQVKDSSKPQNKLKKIHHFQTKPLNSILEGHLPEGIIIDFLSIEVEGQELRILKSFDFEKYCPRWILAELWDYSMNSGFENSLDSLLKKKGYSPTAKNFKYGLL